MKIISDLQIHSKYSRAVSKKMNTDEIYNWSVRKGLNLVTPGDWQHPEYFKEIKRSFKEVSEGIFKLREKDGNVNFILVTEISSIYSQDNKGRRVHNLLFSPSIEVCEKIIKELKDRGANLNSDGRPIIGISSRDLLDLVLNISLDTLIIPAHIWTPWFGMYGSKSGFDSIKECFKDLENYIYAVETGLSSDPVMNWQVEELDKRSIVSFSDAHSGAKIGREATVFRENIPIKDDYQFSYQDIINAIKQEPQSSFKIDSTIEFFPQEGKYHWSGHRNCNVVYSPLDIRQKGTICPICGKRLTIGVENRVEDLSSRTITDQDIELVHKDNGLVYIKNRRRKRPGFISIIPLLEILQEIISSKAKASREYESLTNKNSEFEILLDLSYDQIDQLSIPKLAETIIKLRNREVFIKPGYDGVFGTIKI